MPADPINLEPGCYPDGRRYIPRDGYHTDHSNHERPPKARVLYAVRLPDRGGDTQYVNMYRAYDVYQSRFSERKLMGLPETAKVPDAVARPLVRTHLETVRKPLDLNPIRTEGIVGMAGSEALQLLTDLLAHAIQPQYEYRHRWQPATS